MTEKELLYIEDAIGHETNIISIIKDSIKNMKNEDLISFLENEIEIHNKTKENLMKKMEEKSNE